MATAVRETWLARLARLAVAGRLRIGREAVVRHRGPSAVQGERPWPAPGPNGLISATPRALGDAIGPQQGKREPNVLPIRLPEWRSPTGRSRDHQVGKLERN